MSELHPLGTYSKNNIVREATTASEAVGLIFRGFRPVPQPEVAVEPEEEDEVIVVTTLVDDTPVATRTISKPRPPRTNEDKD